MYTFFFFFLLCDLRDVQLSPTQTSSRVPFHNLLDFSLPWCVSGVLPVLVNTAVPAVSPGLSFTATALTVATVERPATAVSHLSSRFKS